MKRAVIFDLDGTLIDSAPDIHDAANKVLAARGLAPITFDQTLSFIGHGTGVFVSHVMAACSIPKGREIHASLLADFMSLYEKTPVKTSLYPGVIPALETLLDDGFALGLCTNKPIGPTRVVLDHFNLTPFFEIMLGGDSLPVRKPDPEPLLRVLTYLEADAALYVGDSEVDAETAQRAKMPFALFTKGYRKTPVADLPHLYSYNDFADLPAITREHSFEAAPK